MNGNGNDASRSSLGLFLNGEPINNQTTYKYLGLTIDCFLSFDVMIDNICNKLKCRVAMIQRIRYFLSSHHLSSLYYAFIQPFTDYCILIWGHSSASNLNRIQKLQNRAPRIIKNSYDFNISGLTIVKDLNWLNVSQRRDYINNLLIYKCLYCDAPNYYSRTATIVFSFLSVCPWVCLFVCPRRFSDTVKPTVTMSQIVVPYVPE